MSEHVDTLRTCLLDLADQHRAVDADKIIRNLRARAATGEAAHGLQWCDGVRFAANQIEAALGAKP